MDIVRLIMGNVMGNVQPISVLCSAGMEDQGKWLQACTFTVTSNFGPVINLDSVQITIASWYRDKIAIRNYVINFKYS